MGSPDVVDDGGPRVVVALDGSPSSVQALRQGARMAEALGLLLTMVTVWRRFDLYSGYLGGPLDPDAESTARATQATAVAAVFGRTPPAGFEQQVLQGETIATLLRASAEAEMLVLGSRGHGGVKGLLLGSVSAACAAHATCPVLVCHQERGADRARDTRDASEPAAGRSGRIDRGDASRRGEIVVGVDGTTASVGALRQGAQFAESMHLPLLAICATGGVIPSTSDATEVLTAASQQVFGSTPPRWFRSSVRDGSPAVVLGRASEHARMLVIGHSGPRATSRESVGSAIALEAVCPIVVFHATRLRDPESFDGG